MAQAFYSSPKFDQGTRIRFLALLIAILMALVLGVMLWVTQQLSDIMKNDQKVRTVDIAPPPPDDPPMIEDIEPPEPPPPPPPKLDTPPPQLSLDALTMSFSAGTGVAMGGQFGMHDFAKQVQTNADMKFRLADLDSKPRLLRKGQVQYPSSMLKAKREGVVRLLLLIDETGKVTVEKTISADHPDFEAAAIAALEKSKYEPPMREGKKVKVNYVIKVPFRLK
jgi:TonB family protein